MINLVDGYFDMTLVTAITITRLMNWYVALLVLITPGTAAVISAKLFNRYVYLENQQIINSWGYL